MSFWIGPEAAIVAAEAAASALVVGRPEYRDGAELPPEEWVTACWAIPHETAEPGVWAIEAHPDIPTPEGCAAATSVDFFMPLEV